MNGVFRPLIEFEKFGRYFVTSIFQDSHNIFWIGLGDRGMYRMEKGVATKVESNTILDTIPTTSILEDKNGNIWFGTEKGLVVYNYKEFFQYQGAPELANSNINKIIQDREDNIWFATDRNGIGKMTHGKFKLSRLNLTVNGLDEDKDGRVWAATDN
jgi:ligand-binding sensor domain-containing protein